MPKDRTSETIYRADPDAVWKETVNHEIQAKINWEEEWGFLVEQYKKSHMDSAAIDVIQTEKSEEKSKKDIPPYPITTSKQVGWLSEKMAHIYEKFGEEKKPIRTLYKSLGWPAESCP